MIRLIISVLLMLAGMYMFFFATVGVNKYKSLNRIHTSAMGDTLGLLFVITSLVVWRGIDFTSGKLICVILFYWLASPVAGHMISRLMVETDEELEEIEVIRKDGKQTAKEENQAGD